MYLVQHRHDKYMTAATYEVLDVQSVNAGPRLDRLPLSRFHIRVFVLIAGGLFFDQFAIQMAGVIATALLNDGTATLGANAQFFSITFVGLALGALGAGVLGDRFGRRRMYQINLAIVGVATLASAVAPSMTWLLCLRFIAGIGLGAEIGTCYGGLAELVPPSSRGKWLAGASLVGISSIIFSSVIGYYLLPLGHWRLMFVISGIGSLLFCILRRGLPESPRWLEAKGRYSEAEQILQVIEAEVAKGKVLPAFKVTDVRLAKTEGFLVLFSKAVRRRTLIACLLNFTMSFSVFGFMAWLPLIFMEQGHAMAFALGLATVITVGAPVGAGIAVLIADRIGRKKSVIILSIVNATLGAIFATASSDAWTAVTGFLLIAHLYMAAVLSTASYVPELFPTNYRLRGISLGSAIGHVGAMIAPFVILLLFNTGGLAMVVSSIIGLMLFQALVIFIFGIETRGLSLEEIVRNPKTKTVVVGNEL